MPKVQVYDMAGKAVSEIELSDAVFGITPNQAVVHACVVNYLANQRQGTQSTLTRTEVTGGGRKPWRQKGTGHARQGSIRAPQWRKGGIALGPKPRDYSYSLNKKTRRLAIKSVFSDKVLTNDLIVVDQITVDGYKTKPGGRHAQGARRGKEGAHRHAATRTTSSSNPLPTSRASRPRWSTRSTSTTSSTATSSSSRKTPSPNSRRCTHNESSAGHHPPSGHHRGFHGERAAAEVHLPGRQGRQQD